MTSEELNKALYDKMSAEQARYRESLLSMAPEQILEKSYEYAVREDILLSMEYHDLEDDGARALLDAETPLADVFQFVEGAQTGYMDMIQDCVWKAANARLWRERMSRERTPARGPASKKAPPGHRKNPAR